MDQSHSILELSAFRDLIAHLQAHSEEISPADLENLTQTQRDLTNLIRQVKSQPATNSSVSQSEVLESLVESITDGFMGLDQGWRITYINEPASANSFYTARDLIGKDFWEVFPPLRDTILERNFHQAMEDRVACKFEIAGPYQDKWFRVNVYPAEGGISVLWQDATTEHSIRTRLDQLQTEYLLKTQLLEQIIRDAPIGVIYLEGPEHRIKIANPAYLNSISIKGDLVGHTAAEVFPEIGTELNEVLDRVYQTGEVQRVTDNAFKINRNGSSREVYFSGINAPIYDPNGQVQGILGLIMDTTSQVQARLQLEAELKERRVIEQALLESERTLQEIQTRLDVAICNSPISLYNIDRELRYTWVYNTTVFTAEQLLGKRDDQILPAEEAKDLIAFKQSVLDSGQSSRKMFHFTLLDASYDFDIFVEPTRDKSGQVTGLTVAALDVTHQLQEEHIRHNQSVQIEIQHRLLKEREEERLRIARDLHDGPVQSLIGALFLLKSIAADEVTMETKDQLEELHALLQGLLNDLRSFAVELRPPVLAAFGLERGIRSHLVQFQGKHPEIRVHFSAQQTGDLTTHELRVVLFRIYQESLNNIVKHAGATKIWVRFFKDESLAVLEIRDNGIGFDVPDDWLELARQGHLGLVGMRERAEAIGGKLTISSSPGSGSRLRVEIPLN